MPFLPWLFALSMMAVAAPMPFYEENPVYPAPLADGAGWDTTSPFAAGLDEALLAEGTKRLAKTANARSFIIAKEGRIVFERYFHGASVNDSMNVHSASKSLVSALVGIAVAKGILHLDDRLGDLLAPKYRVPENKKNITVRHLLTMTSGIRWVEDETESKIEKNADWIRAILALPQAATPGKKFNYSTGNTHLLSAVLTERTRLPLDHFAEQNLFSPLAVTVEHWGHDPQGYRSGGYNLYLTARELLKLGRLFLDGGRWDGQSVIPSAWIAEAWKPQATADDEYRYGYLWWLRKIAAFDVKKMWGYGGQFVYVVPERSLVVVLTADTQKEYNELDGDAFMEKYVLAAAIKRSNEGAADSGRFRRW